MRTVLGQICSAASRRCVAWWSDRRGAVLVEFAIVANIIIVMNILTYDFASYYRLSAQVKHAAQFIQINLANDTDHILTKDDLDRQITYLSAVTGDENFNRSGTLVVMDVMPVYQTASASWALIVCWSWSSNPKSKSPPKTGSMLSPDIYAAAIWSPAAGFSARSALVIVEADQTNSRLFDVSLIPEVTSHRFSGPIRYGLTQSLNLYLYDAGFNLNDRVVREPDPSGAIACQR